MRLELAGETVELEWRSWRWVGLTAAHVIVVAADAAAWARLEREAELAERLRARVPELPRVESLDPALRRMVRERRAGRTGEAVEQLVFGGPLPPAEVRYRDDAPLTTEGARLADELGELLARFHGALAVDEARALGVPIAPEPLADVATAPGFERELAAARAWWRRGPLVLAHGDPHLGNLVVGERGELLGIFDLEEVSLCDRYRDLRYVHSQGRPFARRLLARYARVASVELDEAEVGRHHAACALEHFGFIAPDAPRYPRIVTWARAAIDAFAPEWVGAISGAEKPAAP